MAILAVTNWHNHPHLLRDQIKTYNAAFDNDVHHVVNINANFTQKFWDDAKNLSVDFTDFSNLHFSDPAVITRQMGIAQAYFSAVMFALRENIKFDYVYFHTSSDLMIKKGANEYIRKFDLGFGKAAGRPFEYKVLDNGRSAVVIPGATDTIFYYPILHHEVLPAFLKAVGLPKFYKSRAEGCFFKREVFFEVMYPLLAHMSILDMERMENPYPIEEYLFAQCVEMFCARNDCKRARHLVSTSTNEKQMATIEEIDAAMANGDIFGIKRFQPKLDAPERVYARQLLGIE